MYVTSKVQARNWESNFARKASTRQRKETKEGQAILGQARPSRKLCLLKGGFKIVLKWIDYYFNNYRTYTSNLQWCQWNWYRQYPGQKLLGRIQSVLGSFHTQSRRISKCKHRQSFSGQTRCWWAINGGKLLCLDRGDKKSSTWISLLYACAKGRQLNRDTTSMPLLLTACSSICPLKGFKKHPVPDGLVDKLDKNCLAVHAWMNVLVYV